MLLIISGLETNPGPEDDSDISIGSLNSIDVSSFCDKFSSSVSFLHLNIQSIIIPILTKNVFVGKVL
jgi:hypothetical protein